MADMKKQDMAEAAEQLLAGTGWLPALMRTPRAAQEPAEPPQADAVTEERTLTLIPSPPSNRHGRDRSRGPGFSSCDCRNFWPRAVGRAANLMMLTPSTGRIFKES